MTEGVSQASLKLSPAAPSRSPCLPMETPTNGHVTLGAPLPQLAPNLQTSTAVVRPGQNPGVKSSRRQGPSPLCPSAVPASCPLTLVCTWTVPRL